MKLKHLLSVKTFFTSGIRNNSWEYQIISRYFSKLVGKKSIEYPILFIKSFLYVGFSQKNQEPWIRIQYIVAKEFYFLEKSKSQVIFRVNIKYLPRI